MSRFLKKDSPYFQHPPNLLPNLPLRPIPINEPSNKKPTFMNRSSNTNTLPTFRNKLLDQAITNLSDYKLSTEEKEVLQMGLGYIPDYDPLDQRYLEEMFKGIERNLKIKYHYRNRIDTRKPEDSWRRSKKSEWQPSTDLHPQLNNFITQLHSLKADHFHMYPYLLPNPKHTYPQSILSPQHMRAINGLRKNKEIVIKKADKGGSIVIMNRRDYVNKALDHLSDTNTYKEVEKGSNTIIHHDILSYLYFLQVKRYLSTSNLMYLNPGPCPRTPIFYFLPKIHKPDNPPRPIISGCDSPTDRISEFLTTILNPIAQAQPSYIRDSTHLISLLDQIPPLPQDTFLVSIDVSSLYTNIPHTEGIQTVMDYIKKHREILPPHTPKDHIIRNFLHLILENNYFEFLDKCYLQVKGVAMGTKMAPPYANIFLSRIEHEFNFQYSKYIMFWRRFLDDIFFIWHGKENALIKFMNFTNDFHPNLTFNYEYSPSQTHFLDLTIYLDKHRQLRTTIYRKDTDKFLILNHQSIHPPKVKDNVVFNETLRYIKNISSKHILKKELRFLKRVLRARDYPRKVIRDQMARALQIPRSTLLIKKPKKPNPFLHRIIYRNKFGPQYSLIQQHIRTSWNRTITNNALKKLFPQPPIPVTIRNRNLTDLLIRSKLK